MQVSRTFLQGVSHNYCHCFSLMSPICGAHQPRRFGSRLMGFLLPVIIPYTNQIVKTLQSNLWRRSGDTFFSADINNKSR
nr:MAG TPA_asm: hypothetical protein [Caudoviricetes sp.]